tara:strand:- start:690 stop:1712 length:1023 start_codon:yes stop_codon:yes gene_type:complete
MNYKFNLFLIFSLILMLSSCEENENAITQVPANDRTEQQVIDNDSLLMYLSTHYYNSSLVNSLTNPTMDELVISELLDGETLPTNALLLIDGVETKSTTYLDVEYVFYILKIKQGEGVYSPRFTDLIRVSYNGSLTDGSVFSESVFQQGIDLTTVIQGWNRVFPEFNVSNSFTSNIDGTVGFQGYGMGVMFLPSGLGYFSTYNSGIPLYSNLIFKFELLQAESKDHDSDNIPSHMEVSESNEFDLLIDTDEDLFLNYLDSDDDGDGTSTSNEIQITTYSDTTLAGLQSILDAINLLSNQFISSISSSSDGIFSANVITLVDTNDNGIPNYLDATESDTIE